MKMETPANILISIVNVDYVAYRQGNEILRRSPGWIKIVITKMVILVGQD